MKRTNRLTEGNILHTLIRFAVPVFFTLFLQALYGGVDLLVVGQFAATADVSGVATGSMLMSTVTMVITGLSMGITILVGERIGRGEPDEAGRAIGGGICLFAVFGVLLMVVLLAGAETLARLLHAPEEAFAETVEYIRICGGGSLFIVAYNVLGAVFRGIGDARTPLFTVMLACVINIGGDLLLVEGFHLGAAGAALATVAAQAVSVVVSLAVIRRRKDRLPFHFSRRSVRFDGRIIALELRLGLPVALQELLVGTSFLVIQTIVNTFGVTASAGVGVAEKVCVFLMLVPSAYMHSMSAFVAQNMGAGQPRRAKRALGYGILTAFAAGLVMAWLAFFHGDTLSLLFAKDAAVAAASHSYLKAYAIDCMLTPFLFCFMGYYNGCEKTLFVMIQGIIGAFGVRIPIAYLVSRIPGATLFQIGLGTPASSTVQIVLCLAMFLYLERRPVRGGYWAINRARNSRVLGWLGDEKKASGAPDSQIRPSAMKTTWLLTSRAKAISWVTTSMVMPLAASARMTASTSPTISGSRAEVGSSKRSTSGSMARARAMATRCFWPPESCLGLALM